METALRVVPAVYTNTNFWHDYIVQPNPNADLSGFARYSLWLVDLAGDAKLPKPWAKAHFVQNHFGENAAPGAPWFETLDQDFFNGSAAELFALIRPGFVLSASSNPPCSAIVCDCQAALNAQGINVGTADGLFGATTKAGVQQYQKTKGLSQTGNLEECVDASNAFVVRHQN